MVEENNEQLLGKLNKEGTGFKTGPEPSTGKRVGAFFERQKARSGQARDERIQKEKARLEIERSKFEREKQILEKKRELELLKKQRQEIRRERYKARSEKFAKFFDKAFSSRPKPKQREPQDDYMLVGEDRQVKRLSGERKKRKKKEDDFIGDFGGDLF